MGTCMARKLKRFYLKKNIFAIVNAEHFCEFVTPVLFYRVGIFYGEVHGVEMNVW